VASDKDSGGTWAGAKESLERRYAKVAVWAGEGAKDGNHALIRRGAAPITTLNQLFDLDTTLTPPPLQNSLF
jgi:predicted Rossmann fold nucleotide-binding protein DprA/Smf involved in DNA uptake